MKTSGTEISTATNMEKITTFEINTSIVIDAAPQEVWKEFIAFNNYKDWNPFIKSIEGKVKKCQKIKVNAGGMNFKPKILNYENDVMLEWLGQLILPGLFDGKHSFKLINNNDGTTTFVHSEQFSGILVPFFKRKLQTDIKEGFRIMNVALKKRVENSTTAG